ncbi:TPA: hypothetical protein RTG63_001755 [Campylobacter jejuni]|nr:hypothetical protein [Campylobacter jejuni]
MKNKNLLPVKILDKAVKELFYTAGMNIYQISNVLNIKTSEVKQVLGNDKIYPSTELKTELVDQILYDADIPVAREVIISTEKERFEKYAAIETKALNIMNKMLDVYSTRQIGEDFNQDELILKTVVSFIKTTQQCREELLKKYEISNKQDENTIKLEFV